MYYRNYRRPSRVPKDPSNPYEDDESMAFHQWLEVQGIPHNHRPNETGGGSQEFVRRNQKMKRMGMSKGAWDYEVFVPQGDGSYRQVQVEMKRRKAGTVSPEQRAWQKVYEGAGIPCKICKGWDEAREFVEQYLPSKLPLKTIKNAENKRKVDEIF